MMICVLCNYFSKLNSSKKAIALVNYLSVDTFTNSEVCGTSIKLNVIHYLRAAFCAARMAEWVPTRAFVANSLVCRARAAFGAHKNAKQN
jgi:hypothetical protein